MIRIAGGTDVAWLAIFDPASLSPEDTRHLWPDPAETIGRLAEQCKLISIPTDSDGGYLLHLYVDEDVPAELARFCQEPERVPGFAVASGRIVFGGVECLPDRLIGNANIRGEGSITPGIYDVTWWRGEYPEDHVESAVRSALSAGEHRLRELPGTLIWLTLLATVIAAIGLYYLAAPFALAAVAPALGIAALVLVFRSATYKAAMAKALRIESDYPSVVAKFTSGVGKDP